MRQEGGNEKGEGEGEEEEEQKEKKTASKKVWT